MAISIKTLLGALACALALIWLSARPAAALPLHAPASPLLATSEAAIKVHDRYRRHGRRHRPRGLSVWFGGPWMVPYVGVPYSGYGYRPGYTYGYSYSYARPRAYAPRRHWRPRPWTAEWVAYCRSKYRSFNPRTGRYLAYSGRYRMCR